MNKNTKRTVFSAAVILLLVACLQLSSFASSFIKTIDVSYRDIKIYIDGDLLTPKDASGALVEPFIYNGTTYLPARAISEALGKTVEWDEETNSVYIGEFDTQITEVTVSTAEEFVKALGSNKRILLEEGVYNLSTISPDVINNTGVYLDKAYDGNELRLDGIHNLTIEGIGEALIIVEPRYAFVMKFQNSSNISISNITAGHTEGGYCAGGVFSFADSSGIRIDKAHMYGCGTVGLSLESVTDMKVTNSSIYECTYNAATVWNCKGILFENCVFRDNDLAFSMFSITYTSDLTINSCEFLRNKSSNSDPVFYVSQSDNVKVTNSTFTDNAAGALSNAEDIDLITSNTFTNNTFEN